MCLGVKAALCVSLVRMWRGTGHDLVPGQTRTITSKCMSRRFNWLFMKVRQDTCKKSIGQKTCVKSCFEIRAVTLF